MYGLNLISMHGGQAEAVAKKASFFLISKRNLNTLSSHLVNEYAVRQVKRGLGGDVLLLLVLHLSHADSSHTHSGYEC